MMGFLAHVPSGGALILPPLVVWEFARPGASITGVLLPTASRPKGNSFWKGCDSPDLLLSSCVDAVRPRDCLQVGRSSEAPGWASTGLRCPWTTGKTDLVLLPCRISSCCQIVLLRWNLEDLCVWSDCREFILQNWIQVRGQCNIVWPARCSHLMKIIYFL